MPRDLPTDLTHPIISPSLNHHSIPLQRWKEANPEYHALIVGAFIFRLSPPSEPTTTPILPPKPQLLLLKRAPTDSYPNTWEPPGGSVDLEDTTILHGLVREVYEETGLRIKSVKGQVWDKDGSGKQGEVRFCGRWGDWWCKLNFMVDVLSEQELMNDGEAADVDFRVVTDDEEHSAWGWFTVGETEELQFASEQARDIVRNAFKYFEAGLKN